MNYLERALGLDPYVASFPDVVKKANRLSMRERNALITVCENLLDKRAKRSQEPLRVSAVKFLVALFPKTLENIRAWLKKDAEASLYEIHFTLFCFLDQVPKLGGAKNFSFLVPVLIEDYLNRVKSETAQAAWMAGDLLGDHWDVKTALLILSQAAQKARFAPGRLGAIHGLSHLAARLKDSEHATVVLLIREISRTDRSTKVRNYSKIVLDQLNRNKPL